MRCRRCRIRRVSAPRRRSSPRASWSRRPRGCCRTRRRPVILAGRCSRSEEGWKARIALAEKLDAPVLTSIKLGAAFPTDHRLHPIAPFQGQTDRRARADRVADVVLSLDWLDLAGTFKQAYGGRPVTAKVIHVSCDAHNHRGWSADHQGLPPTDLYMMCESDAAVPLLLEATSGAQGERRAAAAGRAAAGADRRVTLRGVGAALEHATRGVDVCYTRFPLGWNGAYTQFRHPLDYIGHDGGAGVGSGPAMTVGAGLALKGTGRFRSRCWVMAIS